MKREWMLMILSVCGTLALSLGLIRWLAPGLLGLPSDLRLVQSSEKVPPFYEGVFRRSDIASKEFLLKDPLTRIRAKPFFPDSTSMGPNDLLGFRNRQVPNTADIIIIGDSQTYGNNARIDDNYPSRVEQYLSTKGVNVYNMSTGGWGAVQYFDMFRNATMFKPSVIVVAFYSGNDPIDSFLMAYDAEPWYGFQPDPNLNGSDLPAVIFPPPTDQHWAVTFEDGIKMTFTPEYRLTSNLDSPVVDAGYAIMADSAKRIAEMAKNLNIAVVFTIIPTAELVYSEKISAGNIAPPDVYNTLVLQEQKNIQNLANILISLPGATYVDLTQPLKVAALKDSKLYPEFANGHPIAAGYDVIAKTLSEQIGTLLPDKPEGVTAIKISEDKYQIQLVKGDKVFEFSSLEVAERNGWNLSKVRIITARQISKMRWGNVIDKVDPGRFGPTGSEWTCM